MTTGSYKHSPLILVADDDRFTRTLLRQILEKEGYLMEEVKDGEQCLAAYTKYKPDMVLLDAMMPVMDGFTCCAKLQTLSGGDRIPVLMITGLDDQKSVDRAFEAGATDYITKPIHPPVLRRRLRRLLEVSWAENALRESETKYRSVVDNLKEVIFQTDTLGALTFLNPAWAEITEFSQSESLNRSVLEFIHADDRQFCTEHFQSLIHRQKEDHRFQIRVLTKTSAVAYVEVYASAMLTGDQALIGLSGTLNDITKRKRREQHLSAEHATTRILAETATFGEATSQCLQAICESLGWELGEFWSVEASAHVLRRVETWHRQSLDVSEFEAVTAQTTFGFGVALPGQVWASRKPIWIAKVDEDADFQRAAIAAKIGLQAAFGFPLLGEDETIGVMTFFSCESEPPDPDLLKVMAVIGSQIGQFIKRKQAEAQLQRQHQILQSELNQAAEYVRSLLPTPLTEGVIIEQQFVPSLQLGGDAFDYYWLDRDHLVIYLLDVAGHGVKSALLSVSVLNILRSQSLAKTDFHQPSAVLKGLNHVFQMSETGDDYFTIWYGVYNPLKHQLVYACAGHPPAILVTEMAAPILGVKQLGAFNIPIGMLSKIDFEDEWCEIQAGSTLYLFSDGVYEVQQPNGKIWGLDAFIDLLTDDCKNHSGSLYSVFRYIRGLNANQALDDDFSLLKINLQ